MSENKHTPGPWHVGGKDKTIVYAGDGYAVASCAVYHGRFKNGEVEANASAIAATPALIEACVAMIEWDDREKDHSVDFDARMELCRIAFEKARAAITKATGSNE